MKEKRRVAWVDNDRTKHSYAFRDYMCQVAQARYVIRKAQMIIDGCARKFGIGPLEHQALIQIYGAAEGALMVGQLADRLNIVPPLASRLVKQLEADGYVARMTPPTDRRTMLVSTTPAAEARLFEIVESAHREIEAFRKHATVAEREATHEIIGFY